MTCSCSRFAVNGLQLAVGVWQRSFGAGALSRGFGVSGREASKIKRSIAPNTQLVGWALDSSGLYSQRGPLDQHREQLTGLEEQTARFFRIATPAGRSGKVYGNETPIR